MKILIPLLFAAFISSNAFSQLRIGGRIGFNLSTVTLNDSDEREYRKMLPGVNGGFILDKGKKVAFSTGALFSLQGLKFAEGGAKASIKMTYLKVPVLLKINIGKQDKKISGFVEVGLYLSYWMQATIVAVDSGMKFSSAYNLDKYYDNRIDAGASAGSGISINLGKHVIQAGPSFSMGFTDIVNHPNGNPSNIKPYRNLVLAVLNVTYLYQLKE